MAYFSREGRHAREPRSRFPVAHLPHGAVALLKPPSIEGTYRLESRDLLDGSKEAPPAIDGLLTYTKGYRNFNIYWKDARGKAFSVSYVATYQRTHYNAAVLQFLLRN